MTSSTKRRVIIKRDELEFGLVAGLYFGYPECCSRSFMNEHSALTYGPDVKFPLYGSGFVPCPVCAATYTDEELLDYIENNRFCPVPFPDGDTIDFDWKTNKHLRDFMITLMTEGVEIGRDAPIRNAESVA